VESLPFSIPEAEGRDPPGKIVVTTASVTMNRLTPEVQSPW
jgi:hypothetical protein